MALAYFITFSTYGSWLHGTDNGRGSVDREHNRYGEAFVAADAGRESAARSVMSQSAYTLDAEQRKVVLDAIVELAREKGWRLWAVHVRSNHVHGVVSAEREPGRLMSELKARASRDLNRAGLDPPGRTRWARHGSTRHLFEQAEVEAKVVYTLEQQGEPMAWFDGRDGGG